VTCKESETFSFFAQQHSSEVTVADTNLTVFENAKWAYVVGTAIALKKNCTNAAEAAEAIGIGLKHLVSSRSNIAARLPWPIPTLRSSATEPGIQNACVKKLSLSVLKTQNGLMW